MSYLNLINEDKHLITYRPTLNKITKSVLGTIFLQQVLYWWKKNGEKPFFKFNAPCEDRRYRPGDSWQEELGFTRSEFETARKAVAQKKEKGSYPAGALVVFWQDINRLTWYTINKTVLEKGLRQHYEMQDCSITEMQDCSITEMQDCGISYLSETTKEYPENKEFTPSEKTEPAESSILDDLTDPTLTDHQKAEYAKKVGANTAHPIYRLLKTKAQYCNPSKVLIATAIGILQNITEQEILAIIKWKTKNTIPPYPSEIVGNLTLYRENLLTLQDTPPGPPTVAPAIQALYIQTIGKISAIPTNDALARKRCRESWPQNVQDGVLRILNERKAKSLDRVSLADFAAYCGGG